MSPDAIESSFPILLLNYTVKVKVVPCAELIKHYAMKAYGGSGCIDPHFLDIGTSKR
jgi:hypothetical protein